jgi:hypothetical protein
MYKYECCFPVSEKVCSGQVALLWLALSISVQSPTTIASYFLDEVASQRESHPRLHLPPASRCHAGLHFCWRGLSSCTITHLRRRFARRATVHDVQLLCKMRNAMRYHEYRLQKGALVDVAGKQAATKKGGETCAGARMEGHRIG